MHKRNKDNSGSVFTSIFNNQDSSLSDLLKFTSALPSIIWITDPNGNMQYCNDFGLDYLGFKNSNITNEMWAATVHPNEIESITEKWKNALIEKKAFNNIQRQKNKNNKYEWFKVNANPFFNDKGDIINWVGISINIDEEIRASQELKEMNNRFDLSIKNSKSGIWDWDLDKDTIVYNDNWWEMLGYKKGELEESTSIWERLLHKEDKEQALKKLNDHLKGLTDFYESIYRLKTKAGKWLWIYDSGRVIDRDEKGEPLRFIGMQQDFTSRKFHEDIIKRSESNMRIIADSAQKLMELKTVSEIGEHCIEAIYNHLGQKGLVTFTAYEQNSTVWRVIKTKGYSSVIKNISNILGQKIEGLSGPTDKESVEIMKSGKLVQFEPNMPILFKGIVQSKVVNAIKKLLNLHKIYGIGIVKNDSVHGNISIIPSGSNFEIDNNVIETLVYQTASALERNEIEEKIVLQNSELKELNKEMDVVIKGLSHDLKAPINTAKGILELKKNEGRSDFDTELISKLYSSINRLDGITDDLLGMVFNNRASIEKTNIKINSLVNEVIADQEGESGFQNINWEVKIDQKFDLFLDAKRLKLILRNLISNSIKYCDTSKSKNTIEILGECKKEYLRICVKDNGIGMSKDQLEKVFDMFYRADYTTRGIGLGLHIIKQTVQKLDGTIEINSILQKGTEIIFKIPNHEN